MNSLAPRSSWSSLSSEQEQESVHSEVEQPQERNRRDMCRFRLIKAIPKKLHQKMKRYIRKTAQRLKIYSSKRVKKNFILVQDLILISRFKDNEAQPEQHKKVKPEKLNVQVSRLIGRHKDAAKIRWERLKNITVKDIKDHLKFGVDFKFNKDKTLKPMEDERGLVWKDEDEEVQGERNGEGLEEGGQDWEDEDQRVEVVELEGIEEVRQVAEVQDTEVLGVMGEEIQEGQREEEKKEEDKGLQYVTDSELSLGSLQPYFQNLQPPLPQNTFICSVRFGETLKERRQWSRKKNKIFGQKRYIDFAKQEKEPMFFNGVKAEDSQRESTFFEEQKLEQLSFEEILRWIDELIYSFEDLIEKQLQIEKNASKHDNGKQYCSNMNNLKEIMEKQILKQVKFLSSMIEKVCNLNRWPESPNLKYPEGIQEVSFTFWRQYERQLFRRLHETSGYKEEYLLLLMRLKKPAHIAKRFQEKKILLTWEEKSIIMKVAEKGELIYKETSIFH